MRCGDATKYSSQRPSPRSPHQLLELDGDRVARLANYFYNPDFLVDLGAELGVPVRVNGYRWWLPEAP
jgi:hypothetical protein